MRENGDRNLLVSLPRILELLMVFFEDVVFLKKRKKERERERRKERNHKRKHRLFL